MSITIMTSGLILAGAVAVALMNIWKLLDDSGRFVKKKNDSHIKDIHLSFSLYSQAYQENLFESS